MRSSLGLFGLVPESCGRAPGEDEQPDHQIHGEMEPMRRISVLAVALTLGALFPGVARAWNNAGHMTVALIAYRDLNADGVRLRMLKLLENHPHFVLFL